MLHCYKKNYIQFNTFHLILFNKWMLFFFTFYSLINSEKNVLLFPQIYEAAKLLSTKINNDNTYFLSNKSAYQNDFWIIIWH